MARVMLFQLIEVLYVYISTSRSTGYAVTHLDEALRHKPDGLWFDSRWDHWCLSLTLSFRLHCGPGVDSASDINEFQGSSLGG